MRRSSWQMAGSGKRVGARMTAAQREILKMLSPMARVIGIRYLLDEGRWFEPQPLPAGIRRAPLGLCFRNAQRLVARRPELRYCEGYATVALPTGRPFPAEHGWCIDAQDRVVDPTWCEANDSPGLAYLGIVIAPEELHHAQRQGQRSALWDYRNRFPLVRARRWGVIETGVV